VIGSTTRQGTCTGWAGVERVQHVGQRDRVGRDLQVIGLVQAALVLQRDVVTPGPDRNADVYGVTTSSFLDSTTV